jgi:hypothetical protein
LWKLWLLMDMTSSIYLNVWLKDTASFLLLSCNSFWTNSASYEYSKKGPYVSHNIWKCHNKKCNTIRLQENLWWPPITGVRCLLWLRKLFFMTISICRDFDGSYSLTLSLTLKYLRTLFTRNGSVMVNNQFYLISS